jgi:hypothetical protein
MKQFWTYIKHKRKDLAGISSLKMDGKLYCVPVPKSNILNRQFKSAFSEKTSYTIEEFLNSNRMNSTTTQHPNMKSFDITCNGITKLLKRLCLIYVQTFFIPDRGSLSSGVTTF